MILFLVLEMILSLPLRVLTVV